MPGGWPPQLRLRAPGAPGICLSGSCEDPRAWPRLHPPLRGGHWIFGGAASLRGQVGSPHSSGQAIPHLQGPRSPRRLDPGLVGPSSSPGSVLAQSPLTNRPICCPLPAPNHSGPGESEAADNVTGRVTFWVAAKAHPIPHVFRCPTVATATLSRSWGADPSPPHWTVVSPGAH